MPKGSAALEIIFKILSGIIPGWLVHTGTAQRCLYMKDAV